MSRNRALIVDDSKTAQIRLKRMLERFDVDVDVAFSAEEALGYLSYQMPAVIFMDHHMEGMDGLDALRIIKANPNTATVPVIMYTSESGDVYVGQARALGALDILSKEVIKSSGLEQTLAKLNIAPIGSEEKTQSSAENESSTETESPSEESSPNIPEPVTEFTEEVDKPLTYSEDSSELIRNNIQEVKTQIARLFEIHIADVRGQISDQSKFVVRRLSGEIASLNPPQDLEEDIAQSALEEEQEKKIKRDIVATDLLLLVVITGLIALAVMLYQSQKKVSALTTAVENNSTATANAFVSGSQASPSSIDEPSSMNTLALMDTIGWAMNNSLFIPADDVVFGQEQLLNIQNFVYQLDNAGYKGVVELTVHLGDFCLEQTPEGTTVLAEPSLPLSECYFSRIAQDGITTDDIINVPYVQFEQTAAPIVNGDISLILNLAGFDNPLIAYPRANELTTAGDWNNIARLNNKIAVRLGISSDLL